ncbi:prepilin-type N-terminal cleavage/methylation domain-containing protein [Xylella taiwanensis]|uniref:Type II secretion system protein H n=1 Tax=Xylella taiwanensis TaxID=1444770 RepID=Z9JLZ4_9GAMM|nr:Tfp pilus assembly protein FimT/FimU [Xylella taiwanensis]AXI84202.1 pilus assembly protein [Xylella taiwanensis]EWS78851.1 type 4 fimbrial biogenesis protein [Xylella taiwanensis]MCD8457318.1 Tfp pilus assembly protein FimT/FimU [Xylella taiwanensis]MCD8459729.1 Tfp pilus assembly protein FimT/FimU [Xylella taiwanensis]MCD8461401.1 Tfp pilus assembly protein FimT/FimU [Xylella taiwanensis]
MPPSRGYTLPELFIVMALLTLLTAIGFPFFKRILERQRLENAMYMLSSQFADARLAAITQQMPVSVCPSHGDKQCRQDSNWSRGWITYRDWSRGSQPASSEAILYQEQVTNTDSLSIISTSGRSRVRFLPDGRSAGSNISIRFCNHDRLFGLIVVNNLGRIRSERTLHPQTCSNNLENEQK